MNITLKAYKFRIYPNKAQVEAFELNFRANRFVYNWFLTKRMQGYSYAKNRKLDSPKLSKYDESKALTALKKEDDYRWLHEAIATGLVTSIRQLDVAYQNFFRRVKKGETEAGFPKYKDKRDGNQSFRLETNKALSLKRIEGKKNTGLLSILKIKNIPCVYHKIIQGELKQVTISKNAYNQYFASILVQENHEAFPKTDKSIGIDVGSRMLVTGSDGSTYDNPKALKNNRDRLAFLQKKISTKQKGSGVYKKLKRKIAKVHNDIKNLRNTHIHQVTADLVKKNDLIITEDLAVKNMTKKSAKGKKNKTGLNRTLADASLGKLKETLAYKCEWNNRELIKVDRFYPSSQICHACGFKNKEAKKGAEQLTCPKCGESFNRDLNAAKNIHREGLRLKELKMEKKQNNKDKN